MIYPAVHLNSEVRLSKFLVGNSHGTPSEVGFPTHQVGGFSTDPELAFKDGCCECRRLVIDTLKDVDPSRKCFRLVGGVLVERTVKEVLPALQTNKEQISKILESISTKMQEKGRELTEYRERYNIRLVGEGEAQGQSTESSKDSEGGGSKSGAGVLVS